MDAGLRSLTRLSVSPLSPLCIFFSRLTCSNLLLVSFSLCILSLLPSSKLSFMPKTTSSPSPKHLFLSPSFSYSFDSSSSPFRPLPYPPPSRDAIRGPKPLGARRGGGGGGGVSRETTISNGRSQGEGGGACRGGWVAGIWVLGIV